MLDRDLEPDEEFPLVVACSRCDLPHLDSEGFTSYKDRSASLCCEHCAEQYDEEYEDDEG